MKLRIALLALVSAVAVGVVGSSNAVITPKALTLSTTPPYAYVFVAWAALIVLMAWVAEADD